MKGKNRLFIPPNGSTIDQLPGYREINKAIPLNGKAQTSMDSNEFEQQTSEDSHDLQSRMLSSGIPLSEERYPRGNLGDQRSPWKENRVKYTPSRNLVEGRTQFRPPVEARVNKIMQSYGNIWPQREPGCQRSPNEMWDEYRKEYKVRGGVEMTGKGEPWHTKEEEEEISPLMETELPNPQPNLGYPFSQAQEGGSDWRSTTSVAATTRTTNNGSTIDQLPGYREINKAIPLNGKAQTSMDSNEFEQQTSDDSHGLQSRMLSSGIPLSEERYPNMNSPEQMLQDGGHSLRLQPRTQKYDDFEEEKNSEDDKRYQNLPDQELTEEKIDEIYGDLKAKKRRILDFKNIIKDTDIGVVSHGKDRTTIVSHGLQSNMSGSEIPLSEERYPNMNSPERMLQDGGHSLRQQPRPQEYDDSEEVENSEDEKRYQNLPDQELTEEKNDEIYGDLKATKRRILDFKNIIKDTDIGGQSKDGQSYARKTREIWSKDTRRIPESIGDTDTMIQSRRFNTDRK